MINCWLHSLTSFRFPLSNALWAITWIIILILPSIILIIGFARVLDKAFPQNTPIILNFLMDVGTSLLMLMHGHAGVQEIKVAFRAVIFVSGLLTVVFQCSLFLPVLVWVLLICWFSAFE